jgi:hypothetical protein
VKLVVAPGGMSQARKSITTERVYVGV